MPTTKKITLKTNIFSKVLLGLSAISFLLAGILIYNYLSLKNKINTEIKNQINIETDKAAKIIDLKLLETTEIVKKIAENLNTKKLNPGNLETKFKKIMEEHPYFHGIGIAYKPFEYDKKTKLYAPYFVRNTNKKIEFKPIDKVYDYTQPTKTNYKGSSNWFAKPLKEGPIWLEPYFGIASQAILAEYSVPFYKPGDKEKKQPIGIVFINYDLEDIKRFVDQFPFSKSGYGFLTTKNGILISYPIEDYAFKQINILDLAKVKKNEGLKKLSKKILSSKSSLIEFNGDITGKESWAACRPLTTTKWVLTSVYFKDEIIGKYLKPFRQKEITILLSIIFFLIFIFAFIALRGINRKKILYILTVLLSLILTISIGIIWKLTFKTNIREDIKSTIVIGNKDVKNFLKTNDYLSKQSILVPTGLFIRHITSKDAGTAILVGNLWQKYPAILEKSISKEISFLKSVKTKIFKAYEKTKDNEQILGYEFKIHIPQQVKYKQYPFDYKNLKLRMRPKEYTNNLILTPDFDSYTLINPKSLPGIEEYLGVKGWDLEQSFFSYKIPSYKTSFGIEEKEKDTPVLSFNIIAKRKFLQPFLSHILPLIVALFLLFIGLAFAVEKFFFYVLNATTALFFTIVLAHVSLRNAVPTHEFFYLESFYILTYLLIITVILNLVFRFKTRKKYKFIQYQDNLIPKLLYWPTILFAFMIITAITFY
jgi:hypothetical protein